MVVAVLLGLIALFFPDVVFGGRTLSSTSFQYGVMGESPPYGFPDVESTIQPRLLRGGPDYNYYLADPLAAAVASEPIAEEVSRSLRAGRVPLWSSNWGAGHPLVAVWQVDSVSPLRLPVALAPSPEAWDVFFLARLLFAGLFSYLLARRLGLVPVAAMLVAVGFAFSGYFMLFINMPHVDYAMTLPLVLYMLELLIEHVSPLRLALAALSVAAAILADNPRTAVVMLLFASAYALFRLLTVRERGDRFRRALLVGAAIALGIGLTAWALGPFLEYSDPLAGQEPSLAAGPNRLPHGLRIIDARRMIAEVVPFFEGPPTLGFTELNTDVEAYVGAAVPFLAVLGISNRRLRRPVGWFFVVSLVFAWAKVYGSLAVHWIGDLPLLDQVWFEKYLPPVAAFSAAMLAGLALDELLRRGWSARWVAAAAIGVVSAVAVLLFANRAVLPQLPSGHLALQLSIAGGALGAAALVAALASANVLGRRAAAILLVGIVAADLLVATFPVKAGLLPGPVRAAYERTTLPIVNRPPRHDPFTEPPFVAFLRNDQSTFRIFGLGRVLYPNSAVAFDLDDIRFFAPIPIERYWRYIRAFINPSLTSRFTGAEHLGSEGLPPRIAGNEMLDLLNVKYVLTPRIPESRPVRSNDQFELVHESEGISVFRNRAALPRAFVVHDVARASDVEESLAMMRSPEFEPSRSAVLEQLPESETFPSDSPSGSTAVIRDYDDHRVVIDVELVAKGVLVLTDTFFQGWEARIDDVETSIHPADAAFRGVIVPAGRHRVEFSYAPASFFAGSVIAGVSCLAIAGYAFAARLRPGRDERSRRRRRRRLVEESPDDLSSATSE